MLIPQPNAFRFRWVHPSGATTGRYNVRAGGGNVTRSIDVASTGASPMESMQLF